MENTSTYAALLWRYSRYNPRYLRAASKRRAKERLAEGLFDYALFCTRAVRLAAELYGILCFLLSLARHFL